MKIAHQYHKIEKYFTKRSFNYKCSVVQWKKNVYADNTFTLGNTFTRQYFHKIKKTWPSVFIDYH